MADFTEFFPEDGQESTPAPQPAPTGPSEADVLRQQLQFQNHLLQQVIQPQRQAPLQQEQPPAPPQWTDREYLGEDDTRMILDAPADQLRTRLNRVVNTAVKEVHDSLSSRLRQQEEAEARLQAEVQARFDRQDDLRTTEFWNNTFYNAHDDLRGDQDLVRQATMYVADQVRQEPWRQRSAQDTLNAIADTARRIRQQKLERWGGVPVTSAAPARSAPSSAGRRAAVEGGGSTRVGIARDVDRDAQKTAISQMIDHVRGGR